MAHLLLFFKTTEKKEQNNKKNTIDFLNDCKLGSMIVE